MEPGTGVKMMGMQVDIGKDSSLEIETPYMNLDIDQRGADIFATATTLPAAGVGILRTYRSWEDDRRVIQTLLYQKETPELGEGLQPLKEPGGYLREGGLPELIEKIEGDTGYRVGGLKEIGDVYGHATVRTPIKMYYASWHHQVDKPRDGFKIHWVSLNTAMKMAICGELENACTFQLVTTLWYLLQTDPRRTAANCSDSWSDLLRKMLLLRVTADLLS